jgi:hypothetical protein
MKLTASKLRQIVREEVSLAKSGDSTRFLHGSDSGHPMDDEGYMAKSQMASLKEMATEVCDLLSDEDQLPGWVQSHIAVAHENLQQVHGYLMGDEKMRSPHQPQNMMPLVPESFKSFSKLVEGHNRITTQEFEEWKKGNWGFVEEDLNESSKDDEDY